MKAPVCVAPRVVEQIEWAPCPPATAPADAAGPVASAGPAGPAAPAFPDGPGRRSVSLAGVRELRGLSKGEERALGEMLSPSNMADPEACLVLVGAGGGGGPWKRAVGSMPALFGTQRPSESAGVPAGLC